MYKLCKTEQSSKRQREIERALLQTMLHKRYEDITVSDLCDEMGIPRKSFYRYFSGKDGALYAMIDHVLSDYLDYETRKGLNQQNPRGYMEAVCQYWIQQKPLLDALAKSAMSGVLIQRSIAFTRDMDSYPLFLRTADKQLQEYGAMFATCGIATMMVQWHHDGYTQSVEQMARLLVRLLGEPLFSMDKME